MAVIHRRHTFILPFSQPEVVNRFGFRSSKHPENSTILAGSDDAINLSRDDEIDLIQVYDFQHPRHDRISFPIDGLSTEIKAAISSFKQMSIQWTSTRPTNEPVLSQVFATSPGLYITLAPKNTKAISWNSLKPWLYKFGVGSETSESKKNPFIKIGSLFVYYDFNLRDDYTLQRYLESFCLDDNICKDQVHEIYFADAISISYNQDDDDEEKQQQLVIDVSWNDRKIIRDFHDLAPTLVRDIVKQPKQEISLGLLANDVNWSDRSEYAMVGRVFTLDDDDDNDEEISQPVLFTANYRHIPLEFTSRSKDSYNWSFKKPTGLHPVLELKIDENGLKPPKLSTVGDQCSLQVLMTLPKTLFLDIYEIDNNNNNHEHYYRLEKIFPKAAELEAPEWLVNGWGTLALFHLDPSAATNGVFEFPLHARYKSLKANSTSLNESIGWPTVFWACKRKESHQIHPSLEIDYSTLMNMNQFESSGSIQSTLYKELFPSSTTFHHLSPPSTAERFATIEIPILSSKIASSTIYISLIVVFIGFFWIFIKSCQVGRATEEESKRKQH